MSGLILYFADETEAEGAACFIHTLTILSQRSVIDIIAKSKRIVTPCLYKAQRLPGTNWSPLSQTNPRC